MIYDYIDNIVNEVVVALKNFSTIDEIRLFGSQVFKHNNTSDIDLFIECIDNNEYEIIMKALSKISCKYKIFIHPIIFIKNLGIMRKNQYHKKNIIDSSFVLFKKEVQHVV
jgi:predicted nucleotidyltransferase